MAPEQVMSISVGHGSWQIVLDEDEDGATTFEGSWSGTVKGKIELRRLDVEAGGGGGS